MCYVAGVCWPKETANLRGGAPNVENGVISEVGAISGRGVGFFGPGGL